MLSETEAEFAQYMMGGVWMNMLISFVVLTLFAAWGLWIVWTRHEKRFMTLVQVTNAKDIPKDYSVASPRGVKEKFPDYDCCLLYTSHASSSNGVNFYGIFIIPHGYEFSLSFWLPLWNSRNSGPRQRSG